MGMLGANILGFASKRWAQNFLSCAESLALDVDFDGSAVLGPSGRTDIRVYPFGARIQAVRAMAKSARAQRVIEDLVTEHAAKAIIVRAERLDPAKNTLRGLEAFEILLERRDDLRNCVHHFVLLVPSRENVREYRGYAQEVRKVLDRLNERYPGSVTVLYGEDHTRALGILRRYDVLLVNSVRDGMNLIAQEGAGVNEVDGVIVLSASVGSLDVLGDDALVIENADDVIETADKLEMALDMPSCERSLRAQALRHKVECPSLSSWLDQQLLDLERW